MHVSTALIPRVQICMNILYNNILLIHRKAKVGIWFYIVKMLYKLKFV